MKTKRIVVTQDDINRGERQSFCDCPIARAARRAWHAKPNKTLTVRHEGILVGELTDAQFWIGELPTEAGRFIERFDAGRAVQPLTFTVAFR